MIYYPRTEKEAENALQGFCNVRNGNAQHEKLPDFGVFVYNNPTYWKQIKSIEFHHSIMGTSLNFEREGIEICFQMDFLPFPFKSEKRKFLATFRFLKSVSKAEAKRIAKNGILNFRFLEICKQYPSRDGLEMYRPVTVVLIASGYEPPAQPQSEPTKVDLNKPLSPTPKFKRWKGGRKRKK